MKLQSAVKKETVFIAAATGIGTLLMIAAFFVLHRFLPDTVPFGLPVIAGGIGGCAVAVLNFFLMALSVQKVASTEDEAAARQTMAVSYRYRTLMQLLWVVLAFVLPVFNGAAGIIPLFVPSLAIKARGILGMA